MIDEVRPALTELERVILLDTDDWPAFLAGADTVSADEVAARAASAQLRRPDQHPVHEWYHR